MLPSEDLSHSVKVCKVAPGAASAVSPVRLRERRLRTLRTASQSLTNSRTPTCPFPNKPPFLKSFSFSRACRHAQSTVDPHRTYLHRGLDRTGDASNHSRPPLSGKNPRTTRARPFAHASATYDRPFHRTASYVRGDHARSLEVRTVSSPSTSSSFPQWHHRCHTRQLSRPTRMRPPLSVPTRPAGV